MNFYCSKCQIQKEAGDFRMKGGRPADRCRACECRAAREWRLANPEHLHGQKLVEKGYWPGLTALECRAKYEEMFHEQEGRCLLCGIHQDDCKRRLSVDHDHATGRVRGLLCMACNRVLVAFDSPVLFSRILAYQRGETLSVHRDYPLQRNPAKQKSGSKRAS